MGIEFGDCDYKKPREGRDATRPLSFTIKNADIKRATCKKPEKCVVAQAIIRSLPEHCGLTGIQVGPATTKLYYDSYVVRYRTPQKLRDALTDYDNEKGWALKPGEYRLLKYRTSKNRHDKRRPDPDPNRATPYRMSASRTVQRMPRASIK